MNGRKARAIRRVCRQFRTDDMSGEPTPERYEKAVKFLKKLRKTRKRKAK